MCDSTKSLRTTTSTTEGANLQDLFCPVLNQQPDRPACQASKIQTTTCLPLDMSHYGLLAPSIEALCLALPTTDAESLSLKESEFYHDHHNVEENWILEKKMWRELLEQGHQNPSISVLFYLSFTCMFVSTTDGGARDFEGSDIIL